MVVFLNGFGVVILCLQRLRAIPPFFLLSIHAGSLSLLANAPFADQMTRKRLEGNVTNERRIRNKDER